MDRSKTKQKIISNDNACTKAHYLPLAKRVLHLSSCSPLIHTDPVVLTQGRRALATGRQLLPQVGLGSVFLLGLGGLGELGQALLLQYLLLLPQEVLLLDQLPSRLLLLLPPLVFLHLPPWETLSYR